MSKVNKRKHVMKEMELNDFEPPMENQQIVRVVGSRGNNLHEVESPEPIVQATSGAAADDDNDDDNKEPTATDTFLVTMPNKFRRNIWIKRGDFVIIESITEGKKVKGEIVRILLPHTVHEFKKLGIWPEKFNKKEVPEPAEPAKDDTNSEDDSDDELFKNPNRPPAVQSNESDSDDEESSDEESSDVESDDEDSSDENS